jgi:hypothetical protein
MIGKGEKISPLPVTKAAGQRHLVGFGAQPGDLSAGEL